MDLINIIEKKIYTDGEPYYFNTETMEKYGEIVGGFAWPETKEGFLVIAAVDLFENSQMGTRPIRVLTKSIESTVDLLLKRALELQKHFSPFTQTIKFYGDTTSLAMMELLDQFNRDRRYRGLDPFYLTEAPKLKDTNKHEFYAHLIKKYTQPATKILHFCDTSLPRYLVSLFRDEISNGVLDHPPSAALGYALAVLDSWKPRKKEKRERFEIIFRTQQQGEREGNQDN
jgi:hypothetical protein